MVRARDWQGKAQKRLILDSGAVIALARGEQRARAFLACAVTSGTSVEVPAVVVAETCRGRATDAPVNRVLKAVGAIRDTCEAHARTAGQLLAQAKSSQTIDALVVAHAVLAGGARILTGDPDDLGRLVESVPEVWIERL